MLFFMRPKHIIGDFEGPLEKPLEIADYVFCPHKK
jgi:hypothetical protein